MKIDPEVQKKIMDGLAELAHKLGQGSQYAMSLAVRQCWINGFECLFLALMFLGAFLWAKKFHEKIRNIKDRWGDTTVWLVLYYIGMSLSVIVGSILLINATDLIFNPEYFALQHLIEMVK